MSARIYWHLATAAGLAAILAGSAGSPDNASARDLTAPPPTPVTGSLSKSQSAGNAAASINRATSAGRVLSLAVSPLKLARLGIGAFGDLDDGR